MVRRRLSGRFTFEPRDHIYRVGQWEVPGISEILQAGRWQDTRWYKEIHSTRGDLVHDLTQALDLKLLDLDRLVSPVRGWVLAYAKFVERHHPRHDLIEQAVVHRGLGYATIIDRAGYLLGPAVWNLKSGVPHIAHGIQRAGEALALDGTIGPRRRFTVYLRKNGTFQLEEHVKRSDYQDFYDTLKKWRESPWHDPTRHPPLDRLAPIPINLARLATAVPAPRSPSRRSSRSRKARPHSPKKSLRGKKKSPPSRRSSNRGAR